ncbi:alpha/beta-hydrolase [Trematosphaeria pertusa]|uniref:Carboxylic ester hydrolase n=1 Tax=Trematosphaeria pertusa TaxID=390896 RepID=A0A6A6I8Z3_9PLEO|nr:alpha/beta-hydrolase [Trematosphaeria pertusa]KAF2247034.1 alpha/beta-hydrolase [Trematosphaeria pertusa]
MIARGFSPRLLTDRRILLFVLASVFLSFAFFFHDNLQDAYAALPADLRITRPSTGFAIPPKHPEDPDIVELDYLTFRPQKSEHVKSYWNIPYAASAYGKNRFRGPQPLGKKYEGIMEWSGKLGMCPVIQKIDATLRNKEDIAPEDVPGIDAEHTEDCLSLNVFAPIDAEPGDELPVCVVIPGGGFHLPGRSNGGDMVAKSRGKKDKGIIVVTMYYRNGIYGFLSGEQIQKDGDFNNGLRDQRASLEWVQKYIRYFGGNPDHVVVMGTSAGGASTVLQLTGNGGDHHVSVPGTGRKQLFHGVIAQSPAAPTFYTPEQQEKFWKQVALGVNCTDLSIECVRNAAVGDLYWQNYPMSFPGRDTPPRWMWAPSPEPEGGLWTESATSAIFGGRYAKVPSIVGYTTNEGSDQVKKATDNEGEFKSYLKDHYPLLTDEDLDFLVKQYPNERHWPDSGSWWDAVAKAQGDLRYICPTYLISNEMAKHNPPSVKTWQYQWDVVWGVDIENGYGTKHAASVGQVMARPDNEVSDYFISFIKHLDPNVDRTSDTVKWAPLDMEKPKRLFFTNRQVRDKITITMESPDEARDARCQEVRRLMPQLQQ